MKTFKTLLLTTIVFFSFTACNNDEPKNESEVKIEDGTTYLGLISVKQNDGTYYEKDSIFAVVETAKDSILNFNLLKVKFAERMPEMNIGIPGVTIENTSNDLILSGDNIVPIAMGGEYPAYTITDLIGTITNEKFQISMICGTYPLSFSGTIQ